jgi:hypothetical protein
VRLRCGWNQLREQTPTPHVLQQSRAPPWRMCGGMAAPQGLLPSLARAVGLPALCYVTIQNQGSYLVEVPVEAEKRVPRAWHKVGRGVRVGEKLS